MNALPISLLPPASSRLVAIKGAVGSDTVTASGFDMLVAHALPVAPVLPVASNAGRHAAAAGGSDLPSGLADPAILPAGSPPAGSPPARSPPARSPVVAIAPAVSDDATSLDHPTIPPGMPSIVASTPDATAASPSFRLAAHRPDATVPAAGGDAGRFRQAPISTLPRPVGATPLPDTGDSASDGTTTDTPRDEAAPASTTTSDTPILPPMVIPPAANPVPVPSAILAAAADPQVPATGGPVVRSIDYPTTGVAQRLDASPLADTKGPALSPGETQVATAAMARPRPDALDRAGLAPTLAATGVPAAPMAPTTTTPSDRPTPLPASPPVSAPGVGAVADPARIPVAVALPLMTAAPSPMVSPRLPLGAGSSEKAATTSERVVTGSPPAATTPGRATGASATTSPSGAAFALRPGDSAPAAQLFAAAIRSADAQHRRAPDRETGLGDLSAMVGLAAPVASVASASGDRQPSLDLHRHDWPQQMIEHIETLRDAADAGSTRIRVSPDALGGIDVALHTRGDGVVQVALVADQSRTQALIADAQPELARLGEARGLRFADGGFGQGTGGGASPGGRDPDAAPRRPASAIAGAILSNDVDDAADLRVA